MAEEGPLARRDTESSNNCLSVGEKPSKSDYGDSSKIVLETQPDKKKVSEEKKIEGGGGGGRVGRRIPGEDRRKREVFVAEHSGGQKWHEDGGRRRRGRGGGRKRGDRIALGGEEEEERDGGGGGGGRRRGKGSREGGVGLNGRGAEGGGRGGGREVGTDVGEIRRGGGREEGEGGRGGRRREGGRGRWREKKGEHYRINSRSDEASERRDRGDRERVREEQKSIDTSQNDASRTISKHSAQDGPPQSNTETKSSYSKNSKIQIGSTTPHEIRAGPSLSEQPQRESVREVQNEHSEVTDRGRTERGDGGGGGGERRDRREGGGIGGAGGGGGGGRREGGGIGGGGGGGRREGGMGRRKGGGGRGEGKVNRGGGRQTEGEARGGEQVEGGIGRRKGGGGGGGREAEEGEARGGELMALGSRENKDNNTNDQNTRKQKQSQSKGRRYPRPSSKTNSNWRERGSEEGKNGDGEEEEEEEDTNSTSGSRRRYYMYDDDVSERKTRSRDGERVTREKRGDKRELKNSSHSTSTQQKEKGMKMVTPSLQSSELTEQLTSGSYSCMVCCERVRHRDQIWSCRECFHVFHLNCIGKWATAPASLVNDKEPSEGWRCPACQNPSDIIPTVYKCYCSKMTNPRPRTRGDLTAPHSCGELCGQSLAREKRSLCQHKCQLLCHPGPCPPCPVMVSRSCPCGKKSYQVRCSKGEDLPSCGSECGWGLACGRHRCTLLCHKGLCEKCVVMLSQQCYCGRGQREIECGERGEEENYQCLLMCGKELTCGNHLCELTCHPPPCPPCSFLPSLVTCCPCGATPLSALLSSDQSRTSCLDPVPTCQRTCGRVLSCSNKAEPHFCPVSCHEGQCPPCEKSRLLRCRCGRGSMRIDCTQLGEVGEFACDKPCNKMKSCGRHRCNSRCCVDTVHQCNLICGKKLQCGNHYCMEPCHRGHCQQCWEYSYEELTCHCGAEVLYPPLPCGSQPPSCRRICARMHSCQHPVNHSCHNEQECPPCTVLTAKMCMGGHEERYNIPCHITDISCGLACGKPLPCTKHTCIKTCHRGACMDSPSQCTQPCQSPRKYCSHICGEPCHTGTSCPDVPCKAEVVLTCKCGRMKESVMCGASSSGLMQQAFHKILSKDLGAKIRDLQSGQSVSLARVSLTSLGGREQESLDCDEVCAQVERNRVLAEALGIDSPVLNPLESPLPKYPPALLDQARREMAVAASIEEELKLFVDSVLKGLNDQMRRHQFQAMPSNERKMIHELAPHYGCDSLSYDSEPLRHVSVSTRKSKAKYPSLSLMEMIERERQQKLTTPTLTGNLLDRGSSSPLPPGRISGPLEIDRNKTPQNNRSQKTVAITDYFADDLSN